ncbi:MAG: Wzz/FepE/Etk N-terminal domain-containing protein [Mucinivorans sp.]
MENKIDITAIFKLLWSKRKTIIVWGICGLILGVIIGYSLPKTYRSSVKFSPEVKSGQRSMGQFGGLASMMGMDIGGGTMGLTQAIYPDIIKSSPFIAEFADMKVPFNGAEITLKKYLLENQKTAWWNYIMPTRWFGGDSAPEEQNEDKFRPSPTQNAFESLFSKHISITADKKSGIYDLSVTMQNGEIAAIVADSVLVKLGKYMSDYYTSKTRQELQQAEESFRQAKQNYYNADMAYANAQDKNRSLISQVAITKLDRLSNEKDLAFSLYQQLATQVEMLKIKLQEQTPIATVIEPARVPNDPSAPNKNLIILAFIFVAVFAKSAQIIVSSLLKKSEQE